MGFFDILKYLYNTVSDAIADPEYFKYIFEERYSGTLVMMYNRTSGTNRDRMKRELIEKILGSRKDSFNYQMQLNKDQVLK